MLHVLRVPPPFADPSSIKMIISASYTENFWKSFLLFYVNCIENSCLKSHRVIMVGMGIWRAPPRALNIFHGIAAPPEPRRAMQAYILKFIQVLNEQSLR